MGSSPTTGRWCERARRVLHEIDDISAEMASRGEEVRGEARLGLIGTTARWVLPPLLTRASRRCILLCA